MKYLESENRALNFKLTSHYVYAYIPSLDFTALRIKNDPRVVKWSKSGMYLTGTRLHECMQYYNMRRRYIISLKGIVK